MDELWRLRVKNDAITQMLTGKSWTDTADTLRKRYKRVLARLGQDLAGGRVRGADERLLRCATTRTPITSRRAAPRSTASR